MTDQSKLTKDFIALVEKYRQAQEHPENYLEINKISKKLDRLLKK